MNGFIDMLTGTWTGAGRGRYPTIEDFEYLETLHFTADESRPMLHYEQKTQRRNIGQQDYMPSHWESGFLHLLPDNRVEVASAQSGGRVEVLAGTIEAAPDGLVIRLKSTHFANDARMEAAERTISLAGDILRYKMYMQTKKVPQLTIHLEAKLQRL